MEMGVEREDQLRRRHGAPHAAVDPVVGSHHPAEKEIPSLARPAVVGSGREEAEAGGTGPLPSVGGGIPHVADESGEPPPRVPLLPEEEPLEAVMLAEEGPEGKEEIHEIAPRVEAVAEREKRRRISRTVESAEKAGGRPAHRGEQIFHVAADRNHTAVREEGGQEADDLPILRPPESPDDRKGIGLEELGTRVGAPHLIEETSEGLFHDSFPLRGHASPY
jgi:hypothetical protein